MRRAIKLLAACAVAALAGCADERPAQSTPTSEGRPTQAMVGPIDAPASDVRPEIELYEPAEAEEYANAKRVAGRAAQRAVTYARGATARQVVESLLPAAASEAALAEAIEPVVEPGMRSEGEIVYPQLSGVTPTSLGAMVVTRQTLEDREGRRRSVTRVLDVRLRRSGGPWSLERIASVGGSPRERPDDLSEAAERVLDSSNITLPDSARWDIHRGDVAPSLLSALADAARDRELSVAVLDSGHPPNVWASNQPSAHNSGLAADIWAVDGEPVIEQRTTDSPAYKLAQEFLAGGARQLGSPWDLAPGNRSFADPVHQDHIHLQQSAG
jgi:hypothetical protein